MGRARTGVVLATALLMTAVASGSALATPRPDPLQRRLDAVVSTGAVGAVAEVRDGHRTWRDTSGTAALGTRRPVPVDARVRAGSITKSFTATVVLQLVAEGRIGLDDPVGRWLPGVLPDGDRITVRHLLGHTSGVADYLDTLVLPPDPAFLHERFRTWTASELVARGTAQPPSFTAPGSAVKYSSTGYVVLGELVQRVTGRSWRHEVERRIVRPLHLRGTSVPETSTTIPGPHPRGYVPIDDGGTTRLVDATRMDPSVMDASGAVVSTTRDLDRFFAALLGGRLLPRDLLAQMTTPSLPGDRHALGVMRRTTSCGVPLIGHDGDALSYQAWSFSTPDLRHQVTVAATPDFRGDLDPAVDALIDEAVCG